MVSVAGDRLGPTKTLVTVFPFASFLQRSELTEAQVREFASSLAGLREAGYVFRTAQPGEMVGEQGIPVVLVLTGGVEGDILRHVKGLDAGAVAAAASGGGPRGAAGRAVALVAHPEANSLPAALEASAALGQQGYKARLILAESLGGTGHLGELTSYLVVQRAAGLMANARLGLVGGPSDWLVASSPTAEAVRETWGPTVVPIEMGRLLALYQEELAGDKAAPSLMEEARALVSAAREVREPSLETIAGAVAVYRALRRLVEEEHLSAVTVKCFDLLGVIHNTGCYALARLNDEGIVAGCEGDVPATLTMMLVSALAGGLTGRFETAGGVGTRGVAFMANPAWIKASAPADGSRSGGAEVTLAHCTVPFSLTKGFTIRSHFESGIGVGFAGEWPEGPVTIVRVGGQRLDQLLALEGAVVENTRSERLCRTQLRIRLDDTDAAEVLLHPLGNHLAVVPGRLLAEISEFWTSFVKDGSLSK